MRKSLLLLCFCSYAASPQVTPKSRIVDLRQKGYSLPENFKSLSREELRPSRLLTFHENGDVVAGFVSHDAETLGNRERGKLTLHAERFDREGRFVSELKFSTSTWKGNSIFADDSGNLLVRTPEGLTLYSTDGKVLAKRPLTDLYTELRMLPNREQILLQRRADVEVLDLKTLVTVNRCSCSHISSVSDHNVSFRIPRPFTNLQSYALRVTKICGPTEFEYSTEPQIQARSATLLDDTRFVLLSLRRIELVERDTPRWSDSFGRGTALWGITADRTGRVFAVSAEKYVGGSLVLDINGRLVSLKIIAYRAADGRRLAEVPIQPLPKYPFNSYLFRFDVSPDGSTLGILSEGFLQIVPINSEQH